MRLQTVLSLELQEDLEKKAMKHSLEDLKKKLDSLLIENKSLKAHHDTNFNDQSEKKDFNHFRRFQNKSRDCIKFERKNDGAPLKPINDDFLKLIFLQAHSIEQLL